ncbi:heterokaryon incompatibility protein-domain-containing protein [Xylaria venustula]|nr:heterokaryon incompatibility protein-domain-containing protein [Xylaria venustula]
MISSSRTTQRKRFFLYWPEWQDSDGLKPKSKRRRVMRLFAHWRNKTAPLCPKCRSRKLDLRPLMASPPDISELPENPENEDLDELEKRYAVQINDFSPEEAEIVKLRCSMCALLLSCLDATDQDGWLGHMRCICTLRPRFDWSTNVKKEGSIIHKQQIWVEFQPIEGEVLLDMVDVDTYDVKRIRPPGGRRRAISPVADIKLLKLWLMHCNKNHSHPNIPDIIRSRMQVILDDRIFRLIHTSTGLVEVLASLPTFVALSYVWGSTSGQAKNPPLKGGLVSDYPRTIRDSIATAHSLGYEWLWVDRVCIDQDSDSEKAKLIPYMKDIYAAADLTIVAACGEGAEDGLLGAQGTQRKTQKPLLLGPSVAVLPVSYSFENMMDSSIWSKRGWTFQEYVFSKRLLFAFESEMFFTCERYTYGESMGRRPIIKNTGGINRWLFHESGTCNAGMLQALFHSKEAKTEDLLTTDLFLQTIAEYSRRSLSVKEDRMAAFAGVILSAMGPMDRVSEEAFLKHGHPLPFFEALLGWGRAFVALDNPDPSKVLRVPSWSWAYPGQSVNFLISRRSLLNNYHWFHYTQLLNHDVLGLPTENNATEALFGLPLSDELIADRSWMDSLPHNSKSIPLLPKLHLLTLVFDARLVRCDATDPEEYLLAALGSTGTALEIIRRTLPQRVRSEKIEYWSIRTGCESLFPIEGASPRPQPFETFAIITGFPERGGFKHSNVWTDEIYFNLTVLLLEPTGQKDTYTRLGMNCISHVWKESYPADVIKKGRPRWQYIHIA